MAGNLMPVSVSHYYNSCLSGSNDYACGKGWKMSAHQKVTREEHNELNYFVWEDGDGTQHYFKDEGAQPFKDEEGMDLELYLYNSDGYIVISDKKHNRMRFDIREPGLAWLVAERDALSNEVGLRVRIRLRKAGPHLEDHRPRRPRDGVHLFEQSAVGHQHPGYGRRKPPACVLYL